MAAIGVLKQRSLRGIRPGRETSSYRGASKQQRPG
jgi:hypothetical protein